MVTFPGCKINLGLHVLAKRPDGYHDINTCFYPLPWTDVLEVLPSADQRFQLTGMEIPGVVKDNLCVKAFELLSKDHPISTTYLHLHKVIPPGSGLGGGSADAAHTIRSLNSLFALGLSQRQLTDYAAALGSDCNFFMQDLPVLGSGRGEVLEPVNVALKGFYLAVVVPPVFISTAEAYSKVSPSIPETPLRIIVEQHITMWRDRLKNDFEQPVFEKHPCLLYTSPSPRD